MGFTVSPDLVEAARSGGPALDALLTAVWPEAFRVAFGIVRDHARAEDAAQEACASMALGLKHLRADGAFYAWMYRIIAREATLAAKIAQRRAEIRLPPERLDATSVEDRLDILDAIAALPLAQRSAIVLHYYVGFNSREIAAALGSAAPTVRFHLMLARRSLRGALAVIDSSASKNLETCHDVR